MYNNNNRIRKVNCRKIIKSRTKSTQQCWVFYVVNLNSDVYWIIFSYLWKKKSNFITDAPPENGDAVNGPVNLSTPKSSRSTDSPMEEDKVPIAKSPTPRNDRKRRASDDSSVEVSNGQWRRWITHCRFK